MNPEEAFAKAEAPIRNLKALIGGLPADDWNARQASAGLDGVAASLHLAFRKLPPGGIKLESPCEYEYEALHGFLVGLLAEPWRDYYEEYRAEWEPRWPRVDLAEFPRFPEQCDVRPRAGRYPEEVPESAMEIFRAIEHLEQIAGGS